MNTEIILDSTLFDGIGHDELEKLLRCVSARTARYDKGEIMLREQCENYCIGLVISGSAEASKLDASGKRLVLAQLAPRSVYGEILSLSPGRRSPVTVTATGASEVLLIPFEGILGRCSRSCECHDRVLRNLLRIISQKYFELHDRVTCIMRPTLREKLMMYLNGAAGGERGRAFNIPFSRASLAEHLNAERSALSRELSRMKRDGLIDYYKNTFKLL